MTDKESLPDKFYLDVQCLKERIQSIKTLYLEAINECKKNNLKMIIIAYEDLIKQPQKEVDNILEQLDIPLQLMNTDLKKQNIKPLNEVVINYEEIMATLSNEELTFSLEDFC